MNTLTPKLDVWEAYCDECYYHMWRLRRKTERGWYDGFHIHTGEEAKGLCETLNKLERERDEARKERDRLAEALEQLMTYQPRSTVIAMNEHHVWRDAKEALQSLTPNKL